MAVEDGAALGVLLGRLSNIDQDNRKGRIPAILGLYESMRKKRTTINVEGAVENQVLYHMEDGPECEARNRAFESVDWEDDESGFQYGWGNLGYLKRLMAFDTVLDAHRSFDKWAADIGVRLN